METITVVEGAVSAEMRKVLVDGYGSARGEALPEGLLRTMLIRAGEDEYQIITVWESQEALDRMRSMGKPKAVELFEAAGVKPTVKVFEMVSEIVASTAADA